MHDSLSLSGSIEFAPAFEPRPEIRVVLFDLDGTLSLLRSGWAEVMADLYAGSLPALPGESYEARRQLALQDILSLNGRQTLHQMIRLTERIRERGGRPDDPESYKREFLRRLTGAVEPRKEAVRRGTVPPERWLVPGARAFLRHLRERGLVLYLASGTDAAAVEEEVRLLGLEEFFARPLYGARDESFTKAAVIEEILRRHGLRGRQLLAFGDGVVEIGDTCAVGGLAVGVAVDETNPGRGRLDEARARALRAAGAQVVIADYSEGPALLRVLLGEVPPPGQAS